MLIQNVLLAAESYTHENWVYRNVYVNFSRLYYILDGEGYYTENGQTRRFKKNHIYLTPVRKSFTICDNPHDKILHTYSHITTTPIVDHLIELEVKEGSPLADAVALWRKYLYTTDIDLLKNVIQFLLSCIDNYHTPESALAERIKAYIDHHAEFEPDMVQISHALGYSREHITRSFMTIYHQTPKQYCNQKKMRIAMEKLLDGCRVNEVADYLHYASPFSFSKAYKNFFGWSPKHHLQILRMQKPLPPYNTENT